MNGIIEVHNLCKEFRRPVRKNGILGPVQALLHPEYTIHHAVDHISFTIDEGELVGFIGPNGAGKSTTIKMLTGILVPTAGAISVRGLHPSLQRKEHAANIGVLFGQKTQLWWDIPTIESLRVLKTIYKVPDAVYKRNLDLFRELLGLDEFDSVPVRQLSLGQRMRADLAAALLHNPSILFLDEPTIGVDVLAKERLRLFVQEINRDRKVTVLLTTHDMGDIQKLCNRVLIIDTGRIIYDGGLEQMKAAFGGIRQIVIDLGETDGAPQFIQGYRPMPEYANVFVSKRVDGRVWIEFPHDSVPASALITSLANQATIQDLTVVEPEIESIVRKIYESSDARHLEAAAASSGGRR